MTGRLTSRLVLRALTAFVLSMAVCAPLKAHRLDEYLQTILVDVGREEISLDVTLTPGTAIASSVLATIDTNADATISATEADAYARRVLRELYVTLDGGEQSLTLARVESPVYADIVDGTGVIRFVARMAGSSKEGRHTLVVRNDHRPDVAAYLANALMPQSGDVTIASQARDPLQRSLAIEYTVGRSMSATESTWWTLFSLVLFCGLVWFRR